MVTYNESFLTVLRWKKMETKTGKKATEEEREAHLTLPPMLSVIIHFIFEIMIDSDGCPCCFVYAIHVLPENCVLKSKVKNAVKQGRAGTLTEN